jgi:hypothetical protein
MRPKNSNLYENLIPNIVQNQDSENQVGWAHRRESNSFIEKIFK